MPNTPDRPSKQPRSPEQRKRQQLNDKALQEEDQDAPGERDDDAARLRTEQAGETGEDEDLPEEVTRGKTDPGNFANDREKAREAGRKGGKR